MVTPRGTIIDPSALYDDAAICVAIDVGANTLKEARRNGQLRFARKGNRVLYFGSWIIDWLSAAPEPAEEAKEVVHAS